MAADLVSAFDPDWWLALPRMRIKSAPELITIAKSEKCSLDNRAIPIDDALMTGTVQVRVFNAAPCLVLKNRLRSTAGERLLQGSDC